MELHLIQRGDTRALRNRRNISLKKRAYLHEACRFGQLDSVRFLILEYGAKVVPSTVDIALEYRRDHILRHFLFFYRQHRQRILLARPDLEIQYILFRNTVFWEITQLIGDPAQLVVDFLGLDARSGQPLERNVPPATSPPLAGLGREGGRLKESGDIEFGSGENAGD